MKKVCKNCGLAKSTSEFYADRHMADRLFSKCKVCVVAAALSWQRMKRKTDPDWVMRQREKSRNTKKASRWRLNLRSNLEWKKRNHYKVLAQQAAYRATRRGILKPPPCCSECGTAGPVEKHHHDYSKPLEVVWLCKQCHGLLHRKPRPTLVEA